jgi:hypothetical protein
MFRDELSKFATHATFALALTWLAMLAPASICRADKSAAENQQPAAATSVPIGDEHVKSVWMFDMASDSPFGAKAAVLSGDVIYVAGQSYTKVDGSKFWLWCIDHAGKKLWEKELAHSTRSSLVEIVGLLPNERSAGPGTNRVFATVTVVLKDGVKTILRPVSEDAEFEQDYALAGNDDTAGVIELENRDLLFFGSEMYDTRKQQHTYVARTDDIGKLLWRLPLAPAGAVESDPNPEAPKTPTSGSYHKELFHDAALLGDGSAILVGQAGDYNKFGQGPSKLWLVRVSGDGKKLAEAFIDGGRTFARGRGVTARHGDGIVVGYTTAQLPPIGSAPYANEPSFPNRLAAFNAKLEKLWDKPLPNTSMPGAVSINGSDSYVSASANVDSLIVRGADANGDELWHSTVATPKSGVLPIAVLQIGEQIVAVCNYSAHPAPHAPRARPQLMIVTVTPPRR